MEKRGPPGCSIYLRDIAGKDAGPPPPVDLKAEKRNGDFVRKRVMEGRLTAVHDCSDGGLCVALAEMAMAGGKGAAVTTPADKPPLHAYLFGEDQARYVVTARPEEATKIEAEAKAAGVPVTRLGTVGARH